MLCLSIDIDWAHDAVIADTLELVERLGAKASWFATHRTKMLQTIRLAGGHELGLHPNFNPSLDGQVAPAIDTLRNMQDILPEAVSVRSHSLLRSSKLATLFKGSGLTHESNFFVPMAAGVELSIWRDFSGMIQVPIRWEDDVRLIDPSIGEPVDHIRAAIPFVVDFHPIHIYLNTITIRDYECSRPDAKRPKELLERRRPDGSGGSRDRLIALLDTARQLGISSRRICDLQPLVTP